MPFSSIPVDNVFFPVDTESWMQKLLFRSCGTGLPEPEDEHAGVPSDVIWALDKPNVTRHWRPFWVSLKWSPSICQRLLDLAAKQKVCMTPDRRQFCKDVLDVLGGCSAALPEMTPLHSIVFLRVCGLLLYDGCSEVVCALQRVLVFTLFTTDNQWRLPEITNCMRFIAEAGEFARIPKRSPLFWTDFQAWNAQYGVSAAVLKTLRRRALRCPFPNVFKEVFQEPEVPVIPAEVESVVKLPAVIEATPEEGNSGSRITSDSARSSQSEAASADNTIQEFEASLQFPGGPDAWTAPKEGATTTSASGGEFLLVPVAASGEQSLSSQSLSDTDSTNMHPKPDSASVAAYLSQWIQLKSATSDLVPFKTPQDMSIYDGNAFLQEASPDDPYMHVPTLKPDTEEPPVVAVVQPTSESESESEYESDSSLAETGLLSVAIHTMCRLKSSLPRCSPIIVEDLECAVAIQLHLIHLHVSGLSILAATLLHCLLKSAGFLPELSSFLAQLASAAPATKELSQNSEDHSVHLEDLIHVIRNSDVPEPDIEDVRLEFGREWGRHIKLREEFNAFANRAQTVYDATGPLTSVGILCHGTNYFKSQMSEVQRLLASVQASSESLTAHEKSESDWSVV